MLIRIQCELDYVSSRTRSKMRYDQNAEIIRAAGQAFTAHGCNVEEALFADLEVLTLDTKDNLQASMNRHQEKC